jgi:hypothetical protein
MEKHPHPFDEFLKETLKGHQLAPPEEAKKAFLKAASTIKPARKGWLKWYYFPVLVVLISGTLALLYFGNNRLPVGADKITAEIVKSSPIPDADTNPTSSTSSSSSSNSLSILNSVNESAITADSQPAEPKIAANEEPGDKTTGLPVNNASDITSPQIQANVIPENPDIPVSISPGITAQPENLISRTTSSRLAMDSLATPAERKASTEDQAKITLPESASAMPPTVISEPQKPVKSELEHYFTAGAYYLPEWMFNTIEGDKFVNNFGVEGVFYRGPISIRTGAGISISKGITENSVEYNDYLGTYNKLDSVTFEFNESSHDFLPSFYMSEEKVWDSIAKLDSTNVIKRYTYFQIPLVLGFDFWQKGRFTIGVRVGTIMSVLLNSKQISGPYNPGENQVVGIAMITPDRVSVNWQALGGFDASARLTESIFIELEPQAKYYYQSIYEKSANSKKPWSFGLRTAIIYKF